jgi:hypothetical protein
MMMMMTVMMIIMIMIMIMMIIMINNIITSARLRRGHTAAQRAVRIGWAVMLVLRALRRGYSVRGRRGPLLRVVVAAELWRARGAEAELDERAVRSAALRVVE